LVNTTKQNKINLIMPMSLSDQQNLLRKSSNFKCSQVYKNRGCTGLSIVTSTTTLVSVHTNQLGT